MKKNLKEMKKEEYMNRNSEEESKERKGRRI